MRIRKELESDWPAVHALNSAAFETSSEADLVDQIRRAGADVVSLVAELDQAIIGHILFSPVRLLGSEEKRIVGLAALAVAPGHQNRGIGTSLVLAGLVCSQHEGYGAAVVLGHPIFYPRFGFSPASQFGV